MLKNHGTYTLKVGDILFWRTVGNIDVKGQTKHLMSCTAIWVLLHLYRSIAFPAFPRIY